MPETFDPFKQGVAETLKRVDEHTQRIITQNESIRERVFRKEKHLVPDLNTLYDSQRTPNAWRYTADLSLIVQGSVIAAGQNIIALTMPTGQSPRWRLEQWPNAVQLYYVVNGYGFSQRASVATAGTVIHQFQPLNGPAVCIAMSQTNTPGVDFVGDVLVPFVISDSDNPNIGNLIITLSAGATSITSDLFINIAGAYLLPSYMAYKLREEYPQPIERGKNGNNHH